MMLIISQNREKVRNLYVLLFGGCFNFVYTFLAGLHSESKFEQKYFLYVGLTSVVVVLILFAALLCGIFYRRKSNFFQTPYENQ